MPSVDSEPDLLALAVRGDRPALERLLLQYYHPLSRFIEGKLPPRLMGLAAEDVLQVTHMEAFRHIRDFEPGGDGSFFGWLRKIAERRLQDAIRSHRAAKRGGGRMAVDGLPAGRSSSVADLVEVVAVHDNTPSRSVAGHEAKAAIHVALAGLNDDYRQALTLRYLEGLSTADVAARLGRTEQSVKMLCHRGLRELRAAMLRASAWFTNAG